MSSGCCADIYDEFVKKAAELAGKLKVGNPLGEGHPAGPHCESLLHTPAMSSVLNKLICGCLAPPGHLACDAETRHMIPDVIRGTNEKGGLLSQVSQVQFDKVMSYIKSGVEAGAKVHTGE